MIRFLERNFNMNNGDNMNIVFVIGGMTRGGAERVISILANEYVQKGWKVHIILLLTNSIQYDLHENIEIIDLSRKSRNRIWNLKQWVIGIRKNLKEINPEVTVSFVARINILVILSSIGLRKKIIVSERNDPYSDGRTVLVDILTTLLYPLASKVVFQTKRAKSYFSKKIQLKSIIISNPISVEKIVPKKVSKKIVSVGRLAIQKNHEMLIDAFQMVHKVYPEYVLYIYGEGDLRTKLENKILNLGLEKSIYLPGNIKSIHEHIIDADMFVLSSNYEGLSNALLESMCLGIPCISTNCAGSEEYIRNGENGILIPIKNVEKLAEAIIKLIEDRELRDKISKNSKKVLLQCSQSKIINQWDNLIKGVVDDV